MLRQLLAGQGLPAVEVSRSHSVGFVWMSDQLVAETSDNTQQSQETNIRAAGGIRSRSPSKKAAADLRHRTRGHLDRQRSISQSQMIQGRTKLRDRLTGPQRVMETNIVWPRIG
jgi:hypothetical protein